MLKYTISYPRVAGGFFDLDYYCQKHAALFREQYGEKCRAFLVEECLDYIDGTPAPFQVIGCAYLDFETVEEFAQANQRASVALREDIPHFTDLSPVRTLSLVRES